LLLIEELLTLIVSLDTIDGFNGGEVITGNLGGSVNVCWSDLATIPSNECATLWFRIVGFDFELGALFSS
jgi:hypothetical protein